MKRILVYGDANLDVFVIGKRDIPAKGTEEYVPSIPLKVGGGAALVTLGLGKLGCRPSFFGVLSDDMVGKMITDEMNRLGVNTSKVIYDKELPSGVSISFTDDKDRSFISCLGSMSKLDIRKLLTVDLADVDHIHITGYNHSRHSEYLETLRKLKASYNITISFDVAYDETLEWSRDIYEIMPFVDVFFMNEVEAQGYSRKATPEEACEELSKYTGCMVVKAGKLGSFLKTKDAPIIFEPSHTVNAVDTTGAGDSFNAGFLYAYAHDLSYEKALKTGNFCGARCVTAVGGNTAFPYENEIEFLLK